MASLVHDSLQFLAEQLENSEMDVDLAVRTVDARALQLRMYLNSKSENLVDESGLYAVVAEDSDSGVLHPSIAGNVPQQALASEPETLSLPPIPTIPGVDNEVLSNLLMSWFYCGYYTGLAQRREAQVNQAVRFLADPRMVNASRTDKEAFLRHKGLSDAEITAAFAQSAHPMVSANGIGPHTNAHYFPVDMNEPILWSAVKSIFSALGAMALGVIGYHAYLDCSKARSLSGPGTLDSNSTSSVGLFPEDKPVASGNLTVSELKSMEDRIMDSIAQMKAEQELRYKQLQLQVKEILLAIKQNGAADKRKPGGSIVFGDVDMEAKALPDKELKQVACIHDGETNSSNGRIVLSKKPLCESIDVSAEVAAAISTGIDGTLLLVLGATDKHASLNKSNARFSKIGKNPLMTYCGYVEEQDFFVLRNSDDNGGVGEQIVGARAAEVVHEIKRQRSLNASSTISNSETVVHTAPWLIGTLRQDDKADLDTEKIVEVHD